MQDDPNPGTNPSGFCMCGCGEPTRIAPNTRRSRGWIKGKPQRFIPGHQHRGRIASLETRAKMSAAKIGITGQNHPAWKGGTSIQRGRLFIKVGLDHPMANGHGYVAEYRLVLAEALGRNLLRSEDVHHLDLDETNNAVENLVTVTRGEHVRIHNRIREGQRPLEAMRIVMEA